MIGRAISIGHHTAHAAHAAHAAHDAHTTHSAHSAHPTYAARFASIARIAGGPTYIAVTRNGIRRFRIVRVWDLSSSAPV